MTVSLVKTETDAEFQRRCSDFVQQNITACFSNLVATLAGAYGTTTSGSDGDLHDLVEEAYELMTPVLDYEEAATQHGWKETNGEWTAEHDTEGLTFDTAEDVCSELCVDPYEREIFEHWAVSNHLARRLKDHGEKVSRFDNFEVWARTTTGQSISIDGVIENIVKGGA